MSRKNRNAARCKYDRFSYGKGSMLDKPNANTRESVLDNSNHNRSGSIEETTMINERVGYTYKFLSSSSLETDASYQRRMNEAQVDRIIAEFNPLLVNAVKVSHRDGRFFVFDGAHTLAALRRMHADQPFMVECKVFTGMTYQEEVELFALQTGASRVVSFEYKLRAKLAAEVPKESSFLKATQAAGLRLTDVRQTNARGQIAAKATALKLYETYGEERYVEVLRLLVDTWDGAEWSLSKPMLNGCAVFLKAYGEEYKRDRFIRKLAFANADELAAIARRQRVEEQPRQYALAMLELYNKGGRGRLDEMNLLI